MAMSRVKCLHGRLVPKSLGPCQRRDMGAPNSARKASSSARSISTNEIMPWRMADLLAAEHQASKEKHMAAERIKEEENKPVAEKVVQAKQQRAQEERLCNALDSIRQTLDSAIHAMERVAVEKRVEADSLNAEAAASEAEVRRLTAEKRRLFEEATAKAEEARGMFVRKVEEETLSEASLTDSVKTISKRDCLAAWATAKAAEEARIAVANKARGQKLAIEAATKSAEEAGLEIERKAEVVQKVTEDARSAADSRAKRESLAAWAASKNADKEQQRMVAEAAAIETQETYIALNSVTEELVAEKTEELLAREAAFASVKPCQEDDETTASLGSDSAVDQAEECIAVEKKARWQNMDFLISYLSAEKGNLEDDRLAAQAATKIDDEERFAAERKAAAHRMPFFAPVGVGVSQTALMT